ncbi:MAG: hypothetical protein EOO75_04750 [Myxococcales bacterium]|nr:MAG: hypothetical protein EOO75_04750 [Myxococcales bacterium]
MPLTPTAETHRELVDQAWVMLAEQLEQFFPDTQLDEAGGSVTHAGGPHEPLRRQVTPEPGGGAIRIDWLGRAARLVHRENVSMLASEMRLAEALTSAVDRRFCVALEPRHGVDDTAAFSLEDDIVAQYLGVVEPARLVDALATLRAAALSTYENRQLSTGALLLGTPGDPADPGREPDARMPRYDRRLSTIKGFHRLCDGLHTLFVVDLAGRLLWPADIERWAHEVQGDRPLPSPCAEPYVAHARATLTGGHACLVLMPSHEIKIFADGQFACAFSTARWRILDVPTKAAIWREAVGHDALAERLFQAALDLSEERHGALFVVLRDPASADLLLDPADRLEPRDAAPESQARLGALPRQSRRFLHGLVRGQRLLDLDIHVLESLAGIDGAVVVDTEGRLLSFGAILRVPPGTPRSRGPSEGARTAIAHAVSHHGAALKVSEDGLITLYIDGVKRWEL